MAANAEAAAEMMQRHLEMRGAARLQRAPLLLLESVGEAAAAVSLDPPGSPPVVAESSRGAG